MTYSELGFIEPYPVYRQRSWELWTVEEILQWYKFVNDST